MENHDGPLLPPLNLLLAFIGGLALAGLVIWLDTGFQM